MGSAWIRVGQLPDSGVQHRLRIVAAGARDRAQGSREAAGASAVAQRTHHTCPNGICLQLAMERVRAGSFNDTCINP